MGNKTHVTDRPPPGRRVPRRNSSTGEGGRAPWWLVQGRNREELRKASRADQADPGSHVRLGDSGSHGGSGVSGSHGGSGVSVALALGPATMAGLFGHPKKIFLEKFKSWGRSGGAGTWGHGHWRNGPWRGGHWRNGHWRPLSRSGH